MDMIFQGWSVSVFQAKQPSRQEPADHLPHGAHLLAVAAEVVVARVAEPVETSLRVAGDLARIGEPQPRLDLRVEHDGVLASAQALYPASRTNRSWILSTYC